jgi:transglutaminase-like putative cysteine protease
MAESFCAGSSGFWRSRAQGELGAEGFRYPSLTMKLRIQHRTTYRYAEKVIFGPHRLMLRPREGHDVQIERSVLEIAPAHRIDWIRDVYGNSLAVAHFSERASELMVYSDLVINHFETNPFDFFLEPEAARYPFFYHHETALELSALLQPVYPDDATRVREWLDQFWQPGQTTDTLALLQRINGQISHTFRYEVRHEPGVQSPAKTLEKNSGSCRDFATLFIEACRCLGLGARFVSGYILSGTGAGASTHAWAEIYLPGGGWKGFDPTLGLLTTAQHIPTAVSRHPENAMPIAGSFLGPSSAFVSVEVEVHVGEINSATPVPATSLLPQAQLMRQTG